VKLQVDEHAAEIEDEYGPDIEEALSRWEYSGASLRDPNSSIWASVAFMFSRRMRSIYEALAPDQQRRQG
jgi:hypothetical protein